MSTLLTSPTRFALLTLSMVVALGLLLPQQPEVAESSHSVAAAKPRR